MLRIFSRKPQVEQLENRLLPAASLTATFSAGILTIEGTNNADNISVRQDSSGKISVQNVTIQNNGSAVANVDAYKVTGIVVNGLGGDDSIRLDSESNSGYKPLAIGAVIYGGDGNDTIVGTPKADTIYGGNGDDSINGRSGNDQIFGEAGNDYLVGSDGDDFLYGGIGNDNLQGGAGRDYLDGGSGADTFNGGSDFDTYHQSFNLNNPFGAGAKASDIVQQQGPTCQTLSALASTVSSGFDVTKSLSNNGGGKFGISIASSGKFHKDNVTFDGTWTDNDPAPVVNAQGQVDGNGGFWTILFQRARLQEFGVNSLQEMSRSQWDAANNASYYQLYDGGVALGNFTGRSVSYNYADSGDPQAIANALAAHKAVVGTTKSTSNSNGVLDTDTGIIGWHVYSITKAYKVGATWMVQLYNPWGMDTVGAPHDGANDGVVTIAWSDFSRLFLSYRIA